MRYPRFVAELGLPSNRSKLELGVWSGYGLSAAFLVLALIAQALDVVPFRPGFYVIVGLKLLTNTLAWAGLRLNKGALELSGLNVTMDLLAFTGAIYFTGGVMSPLVAVYAIEITVLGLLANLGITVIASVGALLMFLGMALLTHFGVLPFVDAPAVTLGSSGAGYIVAAMLTAALVVGVPTFFTAAIVRMLRVKEHALEARTHELIEAQRLRSQLMANVTHELRTPIQGVMGLSDLVASGIYGPVTEQQKEALTDVKRSARSLLALIDDLLELSRAEAGKQAYRPAPVVLADTLPTVVASARWMAGTKPLSIELEIAPDLPEVITDRGKLNQIVINLLANAVKFTPDGGSIAVRALRRGERAAIEVTDSGIGIAAEDREKIFEAFRQLDGSPERLYGGVGLGLSVVRHLAQMIGAEVTVESELGKGSTFTVLLGALPVV